VTWRDVAADAAPTPRTPLARPSCGRPMTRDELINRTRQLVEEGERLRANPSLGALQVWLQLSDALLAGAWGSMDRYHLAWLMVGKPKDIVRGRAMTPAEEAAYVRDVAEQKTAALRMSLDAAQRGMPFVGETGGLGAEGARQTGHRVKADADAGSPTTAPRASDRPPDRSGLPTEGGLADRLAEARRHADEHRDHDSPRAPRPERMER
jgi:hypothetical protein